ncbi:MAG: VIT1/CCC1 transporter family protein [Pseudoxanthomonas sp.]
MQQNLDSAASPRRSSLVQRYLDPAASLTEVLFGLIMTLTFTLGAGMIIEDEGREGARQLLIAALGCNIAWGIIDGVFYVMNQLFRRGRVRRLVQGVRGARDERTASAVVAEALEGLLDDVTPTPERDILFSHIAIHMRSSEVAPTRITKADILGGITSFWLVVLTSVPAAVPFMLIDNAPLALRVSNAVLLATLFITGYWWARFTLANPWLVGLSFLLGGGALVAIAIPLGG